jgi:GTPase SAR1 family protein
MSKMIPLVNYLKKDMLFTIYKNIGIIGEKGVGKSAYVHLLQTGRCKNDYEPTVQVKISSIVVRDREEVEYIYTFWEYQEHTCLEHTCLEHIHGFLVFFDMSKKDSYEKAMILKDKVMYMYPDAVTILVGNKADIVKNAYRYEGQYIDISSTSLYKWEEPIQRLGISFFNRRTYL